MVFIPNITDVLLATVGTRLLSINPTMALQIHFKLITMGSQIHFKVMSSAALRPPFCLLKEDLILTGCRLRDMCLSNRKQVSMTAVPRLIHLNPGLDCFPTLEPLPPIKLDLIASLFNLPLVYS